MSKSTVQERFAIAPAPKIERSVFDRSHCHKTTFNSGDIIPIYVDEALPGDTFAARMTLFARLSTALQKPIMDNVYMDVHFFAIPNRLVWSHWKEFCGEVTGNNWDAGLSSTEYFIPTIEPEELNSSSSGRWFAPGSLGDHFGLPTDQTFLIGYGSYPKISALAFRAYEMVWNEWYRDENLQAPVPIELGDTTTYAEDYPIKKRNRRKDYFTSCLPWPQKGDAVTIPIAGSAYVFGTGTTLGLSDNTGKFGLGAEMSGGIAALEADADLFNAGTGASGSGTFGASGGVGVIRKDESEHPGDSGLYADLSEALAITVNELRQVVQLQKMLERDARGGTRYPEILISHFGVVHPLHAVLQRPEFLGGGTIRFITNPVMQTSETSTTPQGNLAAYSVGSGSVGFIKSFMEHCVVIGLASVRADTTYQQGINRMWLRQTREEFYWPSFAHLGEQPVYRQEIWSNGDPVSDGTVFGFQERYAEYRYYPSLVTGDFRSTNDNPIDNWHLAVDFGVQNAPTLSTVVVEYPPIQRVVAVQSPAPEIMLDTYIKLRCTRPMPMYSVPGKMDHF